MKCTIDSDLPKTVFSYAEYLGDNKVQLQDKSGKLYVVRLQEILDDWCSRINTEGYATVRIITEDEDRELVKKIPAIKVIREITGLGLKDAKDFVEGIERSILFQNVGTLREKLQPFGYTVNVR